MYESKFDRVCRICDKLVICLLYVLMADCAVFGAGRTVSVGTFGFRMLLLAVILVLSVPLLIKNCGMLIRCRILWILATFAVWLGLETVLGVTNGNSMSLLAGDVKGFAYFVAVIPVLCVLNTRQRIHRLMKVIMYASAVLAVTVPMLVCLYNCMPALFKTLAALDKSHDITMFAAVSSRIPRLFFKSTPYFLCSCSFSVYFALTQKNEKIWWQYPVISGCSLFALLLSYTRSIYLAVGAAAVLLIVVLCLTTDQSGRKKLVKILCLALTVFILLTVSLSAVFRANYFGYALERLGVTFFTPGDGSTDDPTQTDPDGGLSGDTDQFQQATMESDTFRAQTLAELKHYILEAPILGHGLGKALAVREGKANEYIYYDLWMKTGIIGLLLFLTPAAMLIIELFRKMRSQKAEAQLMVSWLAPLLGFIAFSYFNPYMNASLGILFYCCCIGVVYTENRSENAIWYDWRPKL